MTPHARRMGATASPSLDDLRTLLPEDLPGYRATVAMGADGVAQNLTAN